MLVDIISKDNVRITVDDLPGGTETIDLQAIFEYTHDIDGALERHSALEATWEYQSVKKAEEFGLFEEQTFEVYMTHLRTYARYAARGLGEKSERITMELTKDYVIRLFSERTGPDERNRLSEAAFKGFTIERLGSSKAMESWLEGLSPEDYKNHLSKFYTEMFAWQNPITIGNGPPVSYWYEKMISLRYNKQTEKEQYAVLARAMNRRGYLLKQGAENTKAKLTNMGGMTVDDIVKKVVNKLSQINQGSRSVLDK